MKYFFVKWLHAFDEEPIIIYSELDNDRYETRKVEIFRNGTKGFADALETFGSTQLGVVPVPDIEDIANDPEFLPEEITKEAFERVWQGRYQ